MPLSFLFHRRSRRAALFAAAAIAAALTAEAREGRCIAIGVSSPQATDTMRARRFSATEILDLEIEVLLPRSLTGEHRLDVKVYTPDRQLYQVLTVPFRADEESAKASTTSPSSSGVRGNRKKLADHSRPLDEAEAQETRRGKRRYRRVSATLPVAGTSIVASSLYGRWTAVAFLDGSMESCGPAARFVITQ